MTLLVLVGSPMVQGSIARADSDTSPAIINGLVKIPTASKWIYPSNAMSVNVGRTLPVALTYVVTLQESATVSGTKGSRFVTISLASNSPFPNIFPGQSVSGSPAFETGTAVIKVSNRRITLSSHLISDFNGVMRLSGVGAVDDISKMQFFALPCTGTQTVTMIYPSKVKKGKSANHESGSDGHYALRANWNISKNQPLGCYALHARFVGKVPQVMPTVPFTADFINPANVTITSRKRG